MLAVFQFLSDQFSFNMGLVQVEQADMTDEIDGDEPDVFYECRDSEYVDISDDVVVERRSNEFLYGDTYFEDSISHVALNFYHHLEDGTCQEEHEHESGDEKLFPLFIDLVYRVSQII